MNIGTLRELIKDLPDESEIFYEDPNFGGIYDHHSIDDYNFKISESSLLIGFPFEDPVD